MKKKWIIKLFYLLVVVNQNESTTLFSFMPNHFSLFFYLTLFDLFNKTNHGLQELAAYKLLV